MWATANSRGFAWSALVSTCFVGCAYVLIVITEHETISLDVISKLGNFSFFSFRYFIEPCVSSVRPTSVDAQLIRWSGRLILKSSEFLFYCLSVLLPLQVTLQLISSPAPPCHATRLIQCHPVIVACSVVFPMVILLLLLLLLSLPKAFNANTWKGGEVRSPCLDFPCIHMEGQGDPKQIHTTKYKLCWIGAETWKVW